MRTCARPLHAAFCLLIGIVGCDPTDMVIWSPDGQHAVVISNDANRLVCDAQGRFLRPKFVRRRGNGLPIPTVQSSPSRREANQPGLFTNHWD